MRRGPVSEQNRGLVACLMCCTAVTAILIITVVIWLLVLGFNVSIHALASNLQCDKPLPLYLLITCSIMVGSAIIQIWHAIWRAMHPEGPTDFSWTLVFLIWFSLLFGLALFVMLILGNVWVWSSDKCDNTSTPAPTSLMLPLYQTAKLFVILGDISVGLVVLQLCCIACCPSAFEPVDDLDGDEEDPASEDAKAIARQRENRARAVRNGLLRGPSALIVTPTGALYWARQVRGSNSNLTGNSADPSGGQYQRVPQDEHQQ